MDDSCLLCLVKAVLLLLIANGAPILLNDALGKKYACPVDFGYLFIDGKRLFGDSKTWRGLVSGAIGAGLLALLIDLPLNTGVIFGALVMVGDLLASFSKRRLGLATSSQALGLDTLPESLLPAWLLHQQLGLGNDGILLVAAVFFLIEELLSPWLYRWHIRNKPY
jgi:CDP-diglyceride synthetase